MKMIETAGSAVYITKTIELLYLANVVGGGGAANMQTIGTSSTVLSATSRQHFVNHRKQKNGNRLVTGFFKTVTGFQKNPVFPSLL